MTSIMEDSQIPTVPQNGSHTRSNTWSTRAWGKKPESVVQSIFAREMGLPLFVRCSDQSSNYTSEPVICQQLVKSRGPAVTLDKNKGLRPAKVAINMTAMDIELKPNELTPWVHLVLPNKAEFHLVDNKVWIVQKESKDVLYERFYSINPATFQLKFVSDGHLKGKMAKFQVLGGRSLDEGNLSTYLLTLLESGHLRMLDLVKGCVVDELNLRLNGLTKYGDFDVYLPSKKIFILGVQNGLVTRVYQIFYPPWTEMKIYNIDVPIQNIRFNEAFCIIDHNQNNYLTTWPLITTALIDGDNEEFETPSPSLDVNFQMKIEECPYAIKFNSDNHNCDVLDSSWPPLYYGEVKSNFQICSLKNQASVLFKCPSPDSNVELIPFPDASARILIIHNDHETKHEVLALKTHEIPDENIHPDDSETALPKIVQADKLSDPFSYWDDRRQQPVSSHSGNKRPRRTCSNVNQFSSKMLILTISYSSEMDMIAVLAADDEEFQVVLYKASINLELFMAFPPVLAWPTLANGSNDKKDFLRNTDVVLDSEFLMVFFEYDPNINPNHEVYFLRLMMEKENQ